MAKSQAQKTETQDETGKTNDDRRSCFVIGAIGAEKSETRRLFEGLVDTVVRPALEPEGFVVEDPHRSYQTGSISGRIIQRLLEVDLVVADLTGLNPNVMYELAVRHAKRRPVVQLMRYPIELPFDLKDEHTIGYVDDIRGADELRVSLRRHALEAIAEGEPNNPISRAAIAAVIEDSVQASGDSFQKLALAYMQELRRDVAKLGASIDTSDNSMATSHGFGNIRSMILSRDNATLASRIRSMIRVPSTERTPMQQQEIKMVLDELIKRGVIPPGLSEPDAATKLGDLF